MQNKQINSLAQSVPKTKSKSISKSRNLLRVGRAKDEAEVESYYANIQQNENNPVSPMRRIGNLKLNPSPDHNNVHAKATNKSKKISRLLTSKSLSRLMTRSLSLAVKQSGIIAVPSGVSTKAKVSTKMGQKAKSFPTSAQSNPNWPGDKHVDDFVEEQQLPHPNELMRRRRHQKMSKLNDNLHTKMLTGNNERISSDSMIVLSNGQPAYATPTQCMQIVDDCTLEQANLSPIIGSQSTSNSSNSRPVSPTRGFNSGLTPTPTSSLIDRPDEIYPAMSSTRVMYPNLVHNKLSSSSDLSTSGYVSGVSSSMNSNLEEKCKVRKLKLIRRRGAMNTNKQSREVSGQENGEDYVKKLDNEQLARQGAAVSPARQASNNSKTKTFKPFKTTSLVLRDVKNSLALRMKAKQKSQAFSKLTNELASPPTKLYSPFNFYNTPVGAGQERCCDRLANQLSPTSTLITSHANNTCNKQQHFRPATGGFHEQHDDCKQPSPKDRVAKKHKRHLINQFAIDSPSGRFRETVRDVEKFQQCIEEISEAIQARDHQSSSARLSNGDIKGANLEKNILDYSIDCGVSVIPARRPDSPLSELLG